MSLRAQRSNLVAASTNAVASFRLSPNVIASAAWQSRSHIDQRCRQHSIVPNVIASAARQSRSHIDQRRRQHSIVPKCHCERSVAIPQRHRPTLSPAFDCPQMSSRAQRGNLAAVSTKISDTRPFHHRVASQYPVSSQAIRMAKRALVSPLPDPSSRIRQRVSGSTANFVGICNGVACPSPFNSPDRSAQHGGCHHRPMPRHPSLT